ncbi:MAG TPA: cell division protein FtsL [Syntrophales bacterium]|jgi:cell division protein FtsL|nr:cell division protein FtsL [Syntrophales bacterium]HPX55290.1 cell division protein FtsL [Syntrophales bacterium]HQA83398.1 cell division protein FtsL [Syntrophales bacterium]
MAKDLMIESTEAVREESESSHTLTNLGYSPFIAVAVIIMAVAVMYVWSHNYMTALEYQVASEISKKEALLEEQKKLRVNLATLKSPQRIAAIATNKLQMTYPEREQVVFIKDPGGKK